MSSRRSRFQISVEVLTTISDGEYKPTKIMYSCNLSWKLLQEVLGAMVDQDLISRIDRSESRDKRTSVVYEVTGKGDSVIKYFRHAKGLIDVDSEGFNPLHITRAQ